MRPAPDDIGLLLTPFEICILDDGFVEPHGVSAGAIIPH
jgi:hypothetical protein